MTLEEYLFSYATYLPLFVEGARPFDRRLLAMGIPCTGEIPLYTNGSYSAADSLMLYVGGMYPSCSTFLPLYCHNDFPTASITLFVEGAGENDGYFTTDNNLMLFIKCKYGWSMPLYTIGGPQPGANGSLNLFVYGGLTSTGSLNLVVPNTYGTISGLDDDNGNTLDLYTSGF